MQITGFINIDNKKILVLIRKGRKLDKFCHAILLKKRDSGKDGVFLQAESNYLNQNNDALKRLKDGEVIEC